MEAGDLVITKRRCTGRTLLPVGTLGVILQRASADHNVVRIFAIGKRIWILQDRLELINEAG